MLSRRAWFVAVILALASGPAAPAAPDALEARCVGATEGDLLVVEANGKRLNVWLAGIDAPELKQQGGEDARAFLVEHAYGRKVTVVPEGSAVGDALVAVVTVEGENLSALLVAAGWAWTVPDAPASQTLTEAEAAAKTARKGLWKNPDPVPPWEFRHAADASKPRHMPKSHQTLADVAEDTTLVKNDGDQTVIAGLPVRPYSPPPVADPTAHSERAGGGKPEPAPRPNVISIHEGQGEMPTPRPIVVYNEGGTAGSTGAAAAAAANGPGGGAAAAAVVSSGAPAAVDKYWMDENTLNMVFNVACPGGGAGSLKWEVIYNLSGKTSTWQGSKSWSGNTTSVVADTILHGDSTIIDVRVVEVECR